MLGNFPFDELLEIITDIAVEYENKKRAATSLRIGHLHSDQAYQRLQSTVPNPSLFTKYHNQTRSSARIADSNCLFAACLLT